jgi:Regulator of chromosome condensation (RCC1) repeat
MSFTAHLYGWNDKASNVECVSDDRQPELCFGTQDFIVLSSQTSHSHDQALIVHRRNEEECGLLERCLSSRPNDLALLKLSNSRNHVVYVDCCDTIWSYDNEQSSTASNARVTSAVSSTFDAKVAGSKVKNEQGDNTTELFEQQLQNQIQKSKDSVFSTHRHNLIASKMLIKQIAAGTSHCLLLTQSSEIFSFGTGTCGELGVGTSIPHTNEPQTVIVPGNLGVKYIAAGAYYSAAVTTNGVLFTFGCGAYYRLGHGSDENQNAPKKVEALEGVGLLLPDGTLTGAYAVLYCIMMGVTACDEFSVKFSLFC